ncbi:MAG TPA: imidazolonepropionase [Burkholderiaceae bacterium]|nr:imidazolonepropionase [Burkholderiaceae bacterium]
MTDTPKWDALWTNIHLATLASTGGYDSTQNAALAVHNGKIAWLGPENSLPNKHQAKQHYDGKGCWMTPGLIDCHTHIVYAGNRSNEWEARLQGVSYEEIARDGGGIASTVRSTRQASFDELLTTSLPRVWRLIREGVTTLEIKSGYGLDFASEKRMLEVARAIGQRTGIDVRTTYLGAHALPPNYSGSADEYIDAISQHDLPKLAEAGLVDAVDAFCETIGFTHAQTKRLFDAAKALGLPVKLHAEQLSDQGGAALVAEYDGLSADHLEHLSSHSIEAMAKAGTVAVLLPGAYYFLQDTKRPPVQALRDAKVALAVSTDCNPGTSPLTSLLLAMNMACTLFDLTPEEALAGTTRNAAKALGLSHKLGRLAVGLQADLALWAIDRPADLSYAMGANPCVGVVKKGVVLSPPESMAAINE